MDERGLMTFALDNEKVSYGKIALCCALMAKKHMNDISFCLVTNETTWANLLSEYSENYLSQVFNHVRFIDNDSSVNRRKFSDGKSTTQVLTWHNGDRHSAYDLSPYQETILLDSDYLIQDDRLSLLWGSEEDVAINSQAVNLLNELPDEPEIRLNKSGIVMYWATLVYWKKCHKAELLFQTVRYVKERYAEYQHVYEFPGMTFRNDYAFSIAIHILSGHQENNYFAPLPVSTILSSFDTDDIVDVQDGKIVFLTEKRKMSDAEKNRNIAKFQYRSVDKQSVHVMNKWAILRHADKIIELYGKNI